jgi:hypothetical protein
MMQQCKWHLCLRSSWEQTLHWTAPAPAAAAAAAPTATKHLPAMLLPLL